jgi:hypothetical protein
MPTVTSKNKTAFDKGEMAKKSGTKKSSEPTYAHPQNGGGTIHAYPAGLRVKTDSNEKGQISHTHYGEGIYPHSYRVSSEKNPSERLEHGNYISHTRLTPTEKE